MGGHAAASVHGIQSASAEALRPTAIVNKGEGRPLVTAILPFLPTATTPSITAGPVDEEHASVAADNATMDTDAKLRTSLQSLCNQRGTLRLQNVFLRRTTVSTGASRRRLRHTTRLRRVSTTRRWMSVRIPVAKLPARLDALQ